MRKAVIVAVLVALVLLLAVPATANAGSSRYQFPPGSKITVTVGPDVQGFCPVSFEWPSFPKPARYEVRAYAKGMIWGPTFTDATTIDGTLPSGRWTVVVDAYDAPSDGIWHPGPVLDSLKASFSVR